MAEDVPVEIHHAALPLGFRQVLRSAFHEPAAGIRDDQLYAVLYPPGVGRLVELPGL